MIHTLSVLHRRGAENAEKGNAGKMNTGFVWRTRRDVLPAFPVIFLLAFFDFLCVLCASAVQIEYLGSLSTLPDRRKGQTPRRW
jgi:hypothetical protein